MTSPVDRKKYSDSPIDGFSELWFDFLESAEAAFASSAGQEASEDVPNLADNVAVTYITGSVSFKSPSYFWLTAEITGNSGVSETKNTQQVRDQTGCCELVFLD